jgi:hypothetical protein
MVRLSCPGSESRSKISLTFSKTNGTCSIDIVSISQVTFGWNDSSIASPCMILAFGNLH